MITESGLAVWQADNAMTRHLPGWLAQPFRRRTWAEFLYAVIALPIGIAAIEIGGGGVIGWIMRPAGSAVRHPR